MCLSSWDRLTVIFMTFLKQRCIKTIGFQSAQHLLADLLFLSICLLVVMKSLLYKVDLEASVVDPELTQMTIRYKHGGVIEELLGWSINPNQHGWFEVDDGNTCSGLELSGEGGLRLVGWLETEQGVSWPLQEPGNCLVACQCLLVCYCLVIALPLTRSVWSLSDLSFEHILSRQSGFPLSFPTSHCCCCTFWTSHSDSQGGLVLKHVKLQKLWLLIYVYGGERRHDKSTFLISLINILINDYDKIWYILITEIF